MTRVSIVGVIGSALCIGAVIGVMVLTAITGFALWSGRGEPFNAWLTLAFEVIALGGIAAAQMHNGKSRFQGLVLAISLTICAAAWCGFTQWENLKEEAHKRVLERVRMTELFQTAAQDLREARAQARAWTAADPRPKCECPQTIRSWGETHGAEATRLESLVAQRQARLQGMIPEASIDGLSAARAGIIEALKLLGFVAFGAGLRLGRSAPETTEAPQRAARRPPPPPPTPPRRRRQEPASVDLEAMMQQFRT